MPPYYFSLTIEYIYSKELEEGIDIGGYRNRENLMKEKVQR